MSHPYHHAVSSAKRYGGTPEAYEKIHTWFDSTKAGYAHFGHRAILHNSFGCFLAEQLFGVTIDNGAGKQVPVRLIAEQHIREDLGWIPSIQDWLGNLQVMPWMKRGVAHATDGDIPDVQKVVVTLTPEQAKELYAQLKSSTNPVVEAVTLQIIEQLANQESE